MKIDSADSTSMVCHRCLMDKFQKTHVRQEGEKFMTTFTTKMIIEFFTRIQL